MAAPETNVDESAVQIEMAPTPAALPNGAAGAAAAAGSGAGAGAGTGQAASSVSSPVSRKPYVYGDMLLSFKGLGLTVKIKEGKQGPRDRRILDGITGSCVFTVIHARASWQRLIPMRVCVCVANAGHVKPGEMLAVMVQFTGKRASRAAQTRNSQFAPCVHRVPVELARAAS